ncbi:flagellar biosynthesis protein FlhB [Crenobacter sp. SG2305]|uniref:flagellar biosynthesis protein FlhB n=1 Tax=Crenobacter oryzisoli TaxID=3056844 RepID=UPI0025AAB4A0|nr:flagellar biosynthesis protein FlhB [Crenobacter sp. SG2305]MDN0082591.1 flagellar biosynthesis protein FlhB [Crenobacter sp. SG2305]
MASDSDLERTEAASARRLQQAREDGNVPRSRELSTFAVTMTGVALLILLGGRLADFLQQLAQHAFTFDQATVRDTATALERFKDAMFQTLWQLLPIFVGLLLVAALVPILIGGWNYSLKPVMPKFSKINPFTGIKRLFSINAATEGLKAILKSMLIGGVACWVIWNERMELVGLVNMPLKSALAKLIDLMSHTFLIVSGAMILLVVLDVPYQLWQYYKQLRMTKEEVKREYKEQEGSPEVKGRIRQLQREAARRRMMQEVPNANVIVTNPTHYAVAIKYTEDMRAPRVLAKGSLKVAERIIEIGREHKVTVMRVPSFTRALYFNAEIGDEVPSRLYSAAAQVLAYVYQLNVYQSSGGIAPVFPDQLDVPTDLDPQHNQPPEADSATRH